MKASEEPAAARVHLEGEDPKTDVEAAAEVETDEAESAETESVGEPEAGAESASPAATEPIFTRAVKDTPGRSRRAAQPIYIESQLDDDEAFSQAKAANHQ